MINLDRTAPPSRERWPPIRKSFTDSTHRCRAPQETLAAYEPLMPALGITRLANITGLDRIGIPVVVAIRPASRGLATAQGKGFDLASAKASALMEAIEAWHADTFESLRREGTAIDVTWLPHRPGRTSRGARPIVWTLAHELMSDAPRWVPLEALSCDFSSVVVRQATFLQTTNGLASGNHVLEALVHGLYELIERDAVTLHFQAGRAQQVARQIDLETVESPLGREVLRKLGAADVEVAVWDCTSDLGVPVLSALILDAPSAQRWRPRGPFRGYGCHASRDIALLRALTEAVQSRLTYISGSRDDLFHERFRTLQRMEEERVLAHHLTGAGTRPFTEVPNIEHPTFNDDLDDILARLRAAGLHEAAMFDLTRPDVGVPVVKVLVPGLENNIHHDRNYQPGARLLRARARAS
jgi:ribosomal protein S12 methylthiotransferase accessory factor